MQVEMVLTDIFSGTSLNLHWITWTQVYIFRDMLATVLTLQFQVSAVLHKDICTLPDVGWNMSFTNKTFRVWRGVTKFALISTAQLLIEQVLQLLKRLQWRYSAANHVFVSPLYLLLFCTACISCYCLF